MNQEQTYALLDYIDARVGLGLAQLCNELSTDDKFDLDNFEIEAGIKVNKLLKLLGVPLP
jgi:hypothetical protein